MKKLFVLPLLLFVSVCFADPDTSVTPGTNATSNPSVSTTN